MARLHRKLRFLQKVGAEILIRIVSKSLPLHGGDGEIRTHKGHFLPTFSCIKVCQLQKYI